MDKPAVGTGKVSDKLVADTAGILEAAGQDRTVVVAVEARQRL
jgi:hypothetical protein